MAKAPTLSNITNIPTSGPTINANNEKIIDAFENTLSLDGSTPNAMQADLDLNSNDILNVNRLDVQELVVAGGDVSVLTDAAVAAASSALVSAANAELSEDSAAASAAIALSVASTLPEWRSAWVTARVYGLGDLVRQAGTVYICLIAHTSGVFATDLSSARWEIFAEKGAAGAGTGDVLAANNGSDFANAATVRSNLGLGTIATQPANNVAITGGAITGITDLSVADGGTGSSTASGARTNLGAQIQDADLDAIVAQTFVRGDIIRRGTSGLERLALGANTQVLTSNGTDVTWSAPAATGWTLVETIPMTSGTTKETSSFVAGKSYRFVLQGVGHGDASSRSLQIALFGDTAGAFGTANSISASTSAAGFVYGEFELMIPKTSRNTFCIRGARDSTSNAVSVDYVGAFGASDGGIFNYGTAQTVDRVRFSWTGSVAFDSGSILVYSN